MKTRIKIKKRKQAANGWGEHERKILIHYMVVKERTKATHQWAFNETAIKTNRTAAAAAWQWYSVVLPMIKAGTLKLEEFAPVAEVTRIIPVATEVQGGFSNLRFGDVKKIYERNQVLEKEVPLIKQALESALVAIGNL